MRLFPTQEQKTQLKLMMDQFKWYYNAALEITTDHYGYNNLKEKHIYFSTIRDLVRQYSYVEEQHDHLIFQYFKKIEGYNIRYK